jgi:translocation and assembly module TamB
MSAPRSMLSRTQRWGVVLLAPFAMLAGGGSWLLGTSSGLQAVVAILQRYSGGMLEIKGGEGRLLDAFSLERMGVHGDGWRIGLRDVRVHWQPALLLQGELQVLRLQVRQVEVVSLPSDAPPVLPDTLLLPLDIRLVQVEIGELELSGSETGESGLRIGAMKARYTADAVRHRLQVVHADLPQGELAGTVDVAPQAPFAVQASATFDTQAPLHASYSATLQGDLQHLDVTLDGTGEGMTLQGAMQLLPFAQSPLGRAHLDFSDFSLRWLADDAPAARISGEIDVRGMQPGMLEGRLVLDNAQPATLDRDGLPLRSLRAHLRWSQALMQLYDMEVRLGGGGRLAGEADWRPGTQQGALRLQVQALDPEALDSRAPSLHLGGEIALGSTGAEQQAHVALSDGQLSFEGALHRRGARIGLHTLRLARGDTELSGEGELMLDRQRRFDLETRLRRLDLREFMDAPSTELNAALHATGTLLPEPQVALRFDLERSRFAQHEIEGEGRLQIQGDRRAEGDIALRLGDNALDLELAYGTAADHFRLMLDAPRLEQFGRGLSGQLGGQAELRGSLADPVVSFTLGGINLQLPDGSRIEQVDAGGRFDAQTVALQLAAAGVREPGGMGISEARLEIAGTREQHTLRGTLSPLHNELALGNLQFDASGGWSLADGTWRWQGRLDSLQASGVLPLRLQAPAGLALSREVVTLGAARLALGGGEVELQETRWTPQGWRSAGRFSGLGVRAVEVGRDLDALDAVETLRFGGDWAFASGAHWQGQAHVRREQGDWQIGAERGQQLGLRDLSLALRVARDTLAVQLDASGDRLGEFGARVELPLTSKDGSWTVVKDAPLAGHLALRSENLSWLGPLLHDNLQLGGRFELDADLRGILSVPRLQGHARGEGLQVALLDQGVNLERGNLQARFKADGVQIERLEFDAPYLPPPDDRLLRDYRLPGVAGHLRASGRIAFDGGEGDLQVQAEALPLVQRADRWLIVTGQGGVRYAGRSLGLQGEFRADAGLLAQMESGKPRWSEDVRIIGQTQVRDEGGIRHTVDAGFDLGERFYLRAAGLESRLAGRLKLQGGAGEPLQAVGIIATQDGVFDAYGQRLTVERGMVNFQGPPDDPGLNIRALRKGLSVEAGVEVTGTARHPVVRLVSTPEVPDAEKLSWIVLGRVPESGGIDSSLLLAAAGNILGGSSVGQIGRAVGVDELSLRQRETGDALENQVVTVGKRLSSRAYLSYEQGLSDVGGLTKFTYTLTPRITIVTRTGTEDAVDLFYSFRFY